jgi:hypothetical protein
MNNVLDFESAKFDRDVQTYAKTHNVTPGEAFGTLWDQVCLKNRQKRIAKLLDIMADQLR